MIAKRQKQTAAASFSLDPHIKCERAQKFEEELSARIVGQDGAVRRLADLYQLFLAGLNQRDRPIGTLLFLGPTGSGKTRVVEAAAEILFGKTNAVIKIDCAEFQHSHEIAKLLGSPPGYLGHRETEPLLAQENLDRFQTSENELSFVLFDEIEKASDALWSLLLGILDKATLTLGDNRRVDFSRTVIVMTSNLGAREMSDLVTGGIGFAAEHKRTGDLDEKINRTAVEAARRKFSPEFMNRIDKIVVFRSLNEQHLREILELELNAVQERVMNTATTKFLFNCSPAFKELLLHDGSDSRYGARHLKRSIERNLVLPLANLLASEQIRFGDSIYVDLDERRSNPLFSKRPEDSLGEDPEAVFREAEQFAALLGASTVKQQFQFAA